MKLKENKEKKYHYHIVVSNPNASIYRPIAFLSRASSS